MKTIVLLNIFQGKLFDFVANLSTINFTVIIELMVQSAKKSKSRSAIAGIPQFIIDYDHTKNGRSIEIN